MEQFDNVEAVYRMQEFIKTHLKEPITLHDLSEAANYSPWHAARMFKEFTGKAPFEYIRAYRLSHAAVVIRDEKKKIVDVAFDFMFGSHEGFTKAFSKTFGMAPSCYSETTPAIKLFLPWDVRAYHEFLKKGEKNMAKAKEKSIVFVQIVDRPERKLMLKRGIKANEYFAYCGEVGCDIWGVLTSVKEALYEPVGMWLPKKLIKAGTSEYIQGVELPLDYDKAIPDGYDLITLEPCKMMVFQGQPYDDKDFEVEVLSLMKTIDDYDPSVFGYEWADEDAPRFQLSPAGYRGYIEARPVRLITK
ncbi:MAG: AraC family transcriptional regulator [Candidatus Izemoplasmatales bacterium]|jgi:AraC-like DNA-binding protein|nr:AraC family transcriptional regulator [Candidatus Izemoplasmatales bacterium]